MSLSAVGSTDSLHLRTLPDGHTGQCQHCILLCVDSTKVACAYSSGAATSVQQLGYILTSRRIAMQHICSHRKAMDASRYISALAPSGTRGLVHQCQPTLGNLATAGLTYSSRIDRNFSAGELQVAVILHGSTESRRSELPTHQVVH